MSWVSASKLARYHDKLTEMFVPVGTIFHYAGTVVPDGYLLCSGQAVSRTTYNKLYSVIGTAYGSGDGSTTFNLPKPSEDALMVRIIKA